MSLSLAVILACHNRRDLTLESLGRLYRQASTKIVVTLVDDGSTDGTYQAVREFFPQVRLLTGSGSLFWAASMAMAEEHAEREDPDLMLWLNDDTFMDPDCLSRMLEVHLAHPEAIVVAAIRDPLTGESTYGGRRSLGRHPQRFQLLEVEDFVQDCDTFHGNCVLIPRVVRRTVGSIDGAFPHAYADDDYGLRARRLGFRILQAPGSLATCPANPPAPLPKGFKARWAHLQSPKGLPLDAQWRYLRRHGGWRWPLWFVGGFTKRMTAR